MSRTVSVVVAASGAMADVRLDSALTMADALPELMRLTGAVTPVVTRNGVAIDQHLPLAHLHDGDVLVLDGQPVPPRDTAVRVEVTAGPDAGQVVDLPCGRWVLGREGIALAATDPLVSREHLELAVGRDGDIVVTDLGSSNGTVVDEALRPGQPTAWPAGVELRCGSTRLVHSRVTLAAATAPGPGGTTTVNRPPRLRPAQEPTTVVFPANPSPVTAGRLPLLAALAPLLAGVVLAVVMHRWEFLAFAVMSPLVVLGQAVTDRWAARRTNRAAMREHAAATVAAEQSLAAAVAVDTARCHERAPDLAAVVTAAIDRTSLLWHRSPGDDDALTLRLGLGSMRASVRVEGEGGTPVLRNVPVCLDLTRARVTGVCGDDSAAALARSLVAQAATYIGPVDLAITVLAPGRTRHWAWTRWLPHVDLALTVEQARSCLDRTRNDPSRSDPHSRLRLVVLDGVADPGVAAALAALPATTVLCIGGSQAQLPSACEAVVTVTTGDGPRLRLRTAETGDDEIVADLMSVAVAERVSRALCPLRDGRTGAAAVPTGVAWSELHDVPLGRPAAQEALVRRWHAGPATTVCLGRSADGPYVVDLRRDGPHLLIAGTTGAGKSELLQSLVASLVAANSPTDLNLLLVDFKGGAAFGPCERLPHTLGVLTDLDPATTTRAIESLTAELRRRERLLASAGAPDLDSWRVRTARDGASGAHMPRLVIVVDEFATLADELPDFVGGLVGIAQRGRSLGIHLVLATQRPEGAVSADIRANTRLRVCLAVAREAESRDVLDSPRAVTISRATPGRALVRVGAQELVEVQSARVAGPARSSTGRAASHPVELVPLTAWATDDAATSATGREPEQTTELDLLVSAAVAAAHGIGATVGSPPWLPPLPAQLALSALRSADREVAIGVVDLPHEQRQPPLTIATDTADALLITGGARSGRTTTVLTIATALAAAAAPDRQQMWAIDSGHGLSSLAKLPHTGSVVDVRDVEQVDRLLSHLAGDVERRRASPGAILPRLLLVVDSWDGLVAATADADGGRCQDMLLRLLTQGSAAGLQVVVTTDRSGLTGRLASAATNRLCLRLSDPADYALLGLPARRLPTAMPPGRGIRADDLAFVQVAAVDAAAVATARAWPEPAIRPRRFDPLPSRVPLRALGSGAGGLIVGLSGDDLAPVLLDPDDAGGSFLVAGPPRSGRSTTLVSIAAQLRGRPVVALCARRGPLRQRRDLALVADPADPEQARAALHAVASGATLLVDDIDLVDDVAVLDGIEAAVRNARDGTGFVVLAGTTEAMAASFRGPVAQARRARSGLLLRPESPHDGELLGVRLRRRPGQVDPPGRGVLAMHGRTVSVQVADPA
jgi:DNA segregation ATPase FtsK/SpoIIIE, S-DNA-T family